MTKNTTPFNLLELTDEDTLFIRRRFLQAIETLDSNPFAVMTFASYWNLTKEMGAPIRHGEIYESVANLYAQSCILLSGLNRNPQIWNAALTGHKTWMESLSEQDVKDLEQFDSYKYWHPSILIQDDMSIDGHLKLFPNITGQQDVDPTVMKYENPKSPDALPGAVGIQQHDNIHVVLGRGALQSDEMFVIGFTMGSTGVVTPEDIATYMHVVQNEYKPPYRVAPEFMPSFLVGISEGIRYHQETGIDISTFDFSNLRDRPLDIVRKHAQIDEHHLAQVYAEIEAPLLPQSGRAARRNIVHTDTSRTLAENPRRFLG